MTTGPAFWVGIVTTVGQMVGGIKGLAQFDDFPLCSMDQWAVDLERGTIDAGFRRQVGRLHEGIDKLRSAIRIAAVIESIHADKKIRSSRCLGNGCCIGEKE